MRTKLFVGAILVVCICLSVTSLHAQDINAISVINQYYHNWLGGVEDVYVEGDLAYLACNDDGLRIININNFDAIDDVGQYIVGEAISITVDGDYAFVGTRTEGVYILDISNPENPSFIFSDSQYSYVFTIEIEGNTAFLGCDNCLTILDISNKSEPQTLCSLTGIRSAKAIVIRDNIAYVATEIPGLMVIDITDLSSPEILYTYQPEGINYVNGLDISGNYAFMASGWNGMEVFDLTTHEVVASVDSLVWAFRLEVEGDYAYMTYGNPDCPFAVIDISNPLSPQTMGIYYPPEDLINFMVVEDVAYMADFTHGLRMVDISTPQEPVETHDYSRYGLDLGVIVQGDYAYVKENLKFKIIDISDMHNPFETGYYEFNTDYDNIHLAGDVAFLSKFSNSSLYSFDISDPYAPEVLSIYHDEDNNHHYGMKLYDDYAYIVKNNGLDIVDISNPVEMTRVGIYDEYVGDDKIEISDHYLFLLGSNYNVSLKVFDISDPISPVFVTSYQSEDGIHKMVIGNEYLYMIANQNLLVFDITDFSQWQPIANIEINLSASSITGIETDGNCIYLSDANDGLTVYDVSDPLSPSLAGQITTPGRASGLDAHDGIVFIADISNLGFYDCTGVTGVVDEIQTLPASFSLISNYPNPFNASTNIRFELPNPAQVQLAVYDILGRKTATLADRKFEAGSHMINWNGTSNSGQPVASGRYYIKAITDNQVESLPVMLLK